MDLINKSINNYVIHKVFGIVSLLVSKKGGIYNAKKTLFFAISPSFIRGLVATLDIGTTLTDASISDEPEKIDFDAIHSDWEAVGRDIENAISQWEHEYVR